MGLLKKRNLIKKGANKKILYIYKYKYIKLGIELCVDSHLLKYLI